jgi:hypothetical protein
LNGKFIGFYGIHGNFRGIEWDFIGSYMDFMGFAGVHPGDFMENGKITGFGEFQWEYHGNNRIYHQP